jgi:hypothetical protein
MHNAAKAMMVLGSVAAFSAWAQPTPAPTTGDAPCAQEPGATLTAADTVASTPDADGYLNLFDGTLKGWWQSCQTGHSQGSPLGAIFRIGSDNGTPAIYSTQRGDGIGGLLMTKKKFTNYEIVLTLWPDFGNDGGLFNRTPANGRCFQTVLDYINGAAMGGTWGEGGFPSRDFRPFSFNGNENTLSIPGNGAGEMSNWTTITSKLNPTSFGCPATGCTQADWQKLWDANGWNEFKIQFYGGSAANTGNVHMKTWFRKLGAKDWVPVIQDTTYNQVVPPGYIGLQVHGGNRFNAPKGTWYKGVKWRPLTDKGEPIIPVVSVNPAAVPKFGFGLQMVGNALSGHIDADYSVSIQDVQGKVVERFSGRAGKVEHALATSASGMLTLKISTSRGTESARVLREIR